MKQKALFLILFSTIAGVASGQCLRPRSLQKGDRVALVSPSSATDSTTIERGCAILREWGYVPVVAKNALKSHHGFAGTPQERADDLLWALRDTTIRAVMCTRGGDGAVQILPLLKARDFRNNPKWLIGFSDVTALHSASVTAGVMSIHGSMAHAIASLEGKDTVSTTLRRMLEGEWPDYHVPAHKLNQSGQTEGMLVGGNFSVLSGLAGSPYDCLKDTEKGLILFIEDVNESLTRVDRMLHQLQIRGVLPRLKGIVVGQFTKYKHPENDFDDMYDMLHHYLKDYPIPVVYDFPVGHARLRNFPLIEGARVRLTVTNEETHLEFVK